MNDLVRVILVLLLAYGCYITAMGRAYEQSYPISTNYAIVDFSLPSTAKRFIIYDSNHKELYRTFVAHGYGSGKGVYTKTYSNKPGSYASSLGTYRIISLYSGKNGLSGRLQGLTKQNSNAYRRVIVLHPANYIGYGRTGNSQGCFAVPTRDIKTVYKYLGVGSYIYAVS